MSKLTLDPELRSKLNGLDAQIEVCDDSGKTLGRFLPEKAYRQLISAAAQAACPYTEEELRRFQAETGGTSLAEIWKTLGQT